MYEAVQKCTYCGANLSLDDLRKQGCPYCNTVYPHKSQAAQAMEVNQQLMGQMMAQAAQAQDAWRGAFGAPPLGAPGAPPGGPPPTGGPPGGLAFMAPPNMMPYGMPAPPGSPGSPYADPMRMAAVQAQQVAVVSRSINRIVMIVVGISVAITFLGVGLAMFLSFR
jgi:hypothetical protein